MASTCFAVNRELVDCRNSPTNKTRRRDRRCLHPSQTRGRGYAGSVTAALVERIYAEGKLFVCLYTDLRNSFSNRCYTQRLEFTPVASSWHYVGAKRDTS